MMLPRSHVRRRIRALHALMGSRNLSERQNAWEKLDKMLDEHGLSWNDLPAILAAVDARDGADVANDTATDGASHTCGAC